MKEKVAIYISGFGVLVSLALIGFQLASNQEILLGLVILFSNLTILFANLSAKNKRNKKSN